MGAAGLGSRAIIGTFYETLEQQLGLQWSGRIGMSFDSDQESETYKWLGMPPQMREWIAGRLAKGLRENGLTIVNKKFESTMYVLVDEIRRDKTKQVLLRIKEMADRAAAHWASLVSTFINNGAGATNGLAYDGQYFFDTDHSEGNSGTHKNALAVGDYGVFNVADAAAPTAAEMSAAIMAAIGHFYSYKDDQGEPINELANEFLVMVPFNMYGAAQTAATVNLINPGTGSIDNALVKMGRVVNVATNPRLTATDKFYVFRTDGRTKPFIYQEEERIKMSALAEGSEEEFKNDWHLYGIKAIRNAGYGMWQHAIQVTLS
jgi:phage major head subunit gpT-like protein